MLLRYYRQNADLSQPGPPNRVRASLAHMPKSPAAGPDWDAHLGYATTYSLHWLSREDGYMLLAAPGVNV